MDEEAGFFYTGDVTIVRWRREGCATLREVGLLNRFFSFWGSLPKVRNALRLNDALLTGSWQEKNRFFTQRANASFLRSPPAEGYDIRILNK